VKLRLSRKERPRFNNAGRRGDNSEEKEKKGYILPVEDDRKEKEEAGREPQPLHLPFLATIYDDAILEKRGKKGEVPH